MAAVDLAARRRGPARSTSGGPNGRWFAGVLGSGFDSMVNERANRMTWPSGRSRYNLAILAELRTFRPVPYTLELDGETWQTEAMLVAVGNGSSYGGGMRVCPDARLDDGLLDVTVLGPISKLEFLRVFPTVYKGTHVAPPGGHRAPGPPGQPAPRRASRPTPTASGCRCCRCTLRGGARRAARLRSRVGRAT